MYMPIIYLIMSLSWVTNISIKTSEKLFKNQGVLIVTRGHKHQYSALDAVSLRMIGTSRVAYNYSRARTDNYSFNPTAILEFAVENYY